MSYYRDWIMSTAGLNDNDPTQDSGPSDARFIDFASEVGRIGSSLTSSDMELVEEEEDTPSLFNIPIIPVALITLLLGIITAGSISVMDSR